MEFVMVPVPDEFVVDVMQYVSRLIARSSLVPWTKEGIEEFFDSVEETFQVAAVARRALHRRRQGGRLRRGDRSARAQPA